MKYRHHQLEYEIDDSWLAEAGVVDFTPNRDCYLSDYTVESMSKIFIVPVNSVAPCLERAKLKGVFCDDKDTGDSAKQRVIRILRWFLEDRAVEPVKVVISKDNQYQYKLVEGCHRFHCAVALGFKNVPAAMGFDMNELYA